MKILNKFIIILLIALFIVIALAIYWPDIARIVGISKAPETTLLLESIHNITELQISELIQQYVFPHDFIKSENERIYVEQKRNQNRSLSSNELLQWEAYQLAKKIDLYSPAWDNFVVVTLKIHAGIDFNGDDALEVEVFSIDDTAERGVRIHLPKVQILDIEIQDLRKETYPYPPVQLDANEWQQVSSFVSREARFRVQESDFLQRTEETKQKLIHDMLVIAGFKEIIFY